MIQTETPMIYVTEHGHYYWEDLQGRKTGPYLSEELAASELRDYTDFCEMEEKAFWKAENPEEFLTNGMRATLMALCGAITLFTLFWVVPTILNLSIPGVMFLTILAIAAGATLPIYAILKLRK